MLHLVLGCPRWLADQLSRGLATPCGTTQSPGVSRRQEARDPHLPLHDTNLADLRGKERQNEQKYIQDIKESKGKAYCTIQKLYYIKY